MKSFEIQPSEQATYFKEAVLRGLVQPEDDRLTFFYDFNRIRSRIESYKALYPANSLHSIPVKTAPLKGLLSAISSLEVGLESASEIEFELSHMIQNSAEKCVINAPVRTPRLIKLLDAITSKAFVQVNDLEELELFGAVYEKHKVLVRINPLINANTESYLQTADLDSKFGQVISDQEAIINAFKHHPYLCGLHVHTGSDFKDFSPTVQGIKKVYDLATEIQKQLGEDRIQYINIGGGLSAECNLEDFIKALKSEVPELWDDEHIQVITELGRFTYFHSGWCVSAVEMIKQNQDKRVVLSELGAHTFVREIYTSDAPLHTIHVLNPDFDLRETKTENIALAGPLCFGGDYISKDISLPRIYRNDWLIMGNTGANALGLFSKHCSQPFPKVLMYDSKLGPDSLHIIKSKESAEEVMNFW